ncbi:MAG: glycosyltransferase family 39 protein [Allorhizobium sp.]
MEVTRQGTTSLFQRTLNGLAKAKYGYLIFLVVYGLVWTVTPLLSNAGMPVDVVEELAWAREWPLGIYRHPPMMVWLLEIAWQATGQWIGSIYLLSAVAFGVGAFFLYKLVRTERPASQAFAATALIMLIYYFATQLPQWNANIAQLPFTGLFLYALWRALKYDSAAMWIVAALAAVGGFLAKYSFALLVLSAAVVVLADPSLRRRIRPLYLGLAFVAFCLSLGPHLWWFLHSESAVEGYIAMSLGRDSGTWLRHIYNPPLVVLTTVGVLLPAYLFLRFGFDRTASSTMRDDDDRGLTKILVAAVAGPVLASALIGAVTGGLIKDHWLIAYLLAAPAAMMMVMVAPDTQLQWTKAAGRLFALILAVLVIVYPAERQRTYLFNKIQPAGWSPLMPVEPLADAASAFWRDTLRNAGLPDVTATVVAGGIPAATATNLMDGRPAWLEKFETVLSPWVTADMLSQNGALAIGPVADGFIEEYRLCIAATMVYDWRNGKGEIANHLPMTVLLPQGRCRN